MSIAAKWTDLVVGTCLHPVVIPPAVPAVFPQIYIGLIHDVLGELMAPAIAWVFGSPPAGPVIINGLPAATTGQDGTNLVICPHLVPLPPGAAWGCVPTGDADLLWGSETVYIRGGRAVRLGDLAMTDSDPVALPLGLVFAVPHGKPVVIGGPQAIDAIAAAASLAASAAAAVARRALRALRDSSLWNRGARALGREAASEGAESAAQRATTAASRNARDQAPPGRVARRGDPVDVATGRVLAGKTDWDLPGPIPLSFRREYSSSLSWRRLSLGYGWSHSFEQAVWLGLGKIVYRSEDGRELEYNTFNRAGDVLHPGDAIVDAANGWTLRCTGAFRFEVETHDGLIREFAPLTDSYRSGELPVSRLRRIWTRDGNAVRFVYDVRTGVLATVCDSAGRRVLFEHDEAGNLRRVLLPDPRTENAHRERFRYEQSTEGDLAAVMDARGRPFRYVYSGHLLVQTTDRNGMSFYWAYLGHGPTAWCRQSWGDGGLLNTTFVYDKVQRFTFVTDSNGAWKKYFWNEDGLVVRIMDGYRGEERFEHDERGLLIAFIDRAGRTTKATYDFYGSLTSITQPDGGVHQFEYRDRQLVRRIDPLGAIFELHRDEAGRVVELVDPLGARTRHEWAGGLLRATIEPGGRRTELEYDEEKNLVLGRTPDGVEHRAKYDRLGRMIERRNPREARLPAGGRLPIREEWVWDVTGLLDSCQALDGTRSALTWDAEGRLLSERTLSRETRYAYAGPGWLVSREEVTERGEPAAIVKLGYDREGQLVEVRNENDETWQMGYDARGDLVFERLYDGGLRRLRRNRKTGDLDEILEPSASTRQWNPRRNRWQYNVALAGRRTRHTQDAAGRLTRLDHSDGTFTAWSFDRAGRLASVQNAAGEVVFDRDLSGRVVRETFRRHDETPTLIESAHDLLGKRIGIATSLGLRVTFERDLMGDLAAAEAALPQGAPHRVALARDLEGRETTRRFSNGISVHSQRDDAGRITERRTDSPAAVLETVGYGWTDEGQLHWKVDRESRRGLHCFYDPRGRLIATRPPDAPGAREWRNPDLVGNLFRTPDRSDRRYGPGGVLLEADGTSYQHDADGYLVEKRASDGRTWRYAWNAEGCLHSVQTPDGQCVENLYDGLGRRVAKTLKDPSGATVKELRFVWDGDTIAHELSSDEEPTAWVFEPGSFTPLAKLQGQRRFGTVTDHLGTPEALYDEAGDLAWKAQLDLYGVCQIDVETTKQPWRWPGQYEDEETGLYYNRYRWYEPASGQYISRDPIGMDGGFAPYAYAPDPFGWIDPLGLMPWVNPTDSGHHIVPHSGASHLGIEHFNREHGVPSFFFPEPYSPSAHERLQGRGALERPPLTSRSIDRAQLTRRQWMDRLRRNYFRPEIQDIRGDLRIVTARGPGRVIASNVTPREAWIATMLWRAAQQEDPCG